MVLPQLPVPQVENSLERLERTLSAIVRQESVSQTMAEAKGFEHEPGRSLQADLELFADSEHRRGRNWLSDEWLSQYLSSRGALPLTSNIAFELSVMGPRTTSVDLYAAEVIRRIATVHLTEVRGETEPEIDARISSDDGPVASIQGWTATSWSRAGHLAAST